MKIYIFGVVVAPFELKLPVAEAKRTDQPFWNIPESISSRKTIKSVQNHEKQI